MSSRRKSAATRPGSLRALYVLPVTALVLWLYWHYCDSGRLRLALDARAAPSWPPEPEPAGVLLVCAYFPLPASKHGQDEYFDWLRRLLGTVRADLYMYAPPALGPVLREMRGGLAMHLNDSYASAWDLPPVAQLAGPLRAMHALDPEARYHNADLYAVWAAKPYLVHAAVEHTAATLPGAGAYRWALWIDAGTFRRDHVFRAWPDIGALETYFAEAAAATGTPADELMLVSVQLALPARFAAWRPEDGPVSADLAMGSFFGGSPPALRWFAAALDALLRSYAAAGKFAGKDQEVWNALMLARPARFAAVWGRDPRHAHIERWDGPGDCGGWWGYYVHWLANRRERAADDRQFFRGHRCEMARVRPFEYVLRATFGRRWRPPAAPLLDAVERDLGSWDWAAKRDAVVWPGDVA